MGLVKVNETLLLNAEYVLDAWLKGELVGDEYTAINPTRDDKSLGSFKINIKTIRLVVNYCNFGA